MNKLASFLCLALGLGLLGVDASPSPAASSAPTNAPAQVVHMKNFMFAPAKVTVHVGDPVKWVNDDSVQHSATAIGKAWDSGELSQGQSWTHVFSKTGVYLYNCDDHEFMRAEIDVVI